MGIDRSLVNSLGVHNLDRNCDWTLRLQLEAGFTPRSWFYNSKLILQPEVENTTRSWCYNSKLRSQLETDTTTRSWYYNQKLIIQFEVDITTRSQYHNSKLILLTGVPERFILSDFAHLRMCVNAFIRSSEIEARSSAFVANEHLDSRRTIARTQTNGTEIFTPI